MTLDEMADAVLSLKSEARDVARRMLFPSGMVGDTSKLVNDARLSVLEEQFASLVAVVGGYPDGKLEEKIGLMLIDYWKKVVEEVKGT